MTSLPALGGPGLLLSAVIDGSYVPLPLVTDLILINLVSAHPLRLPYYVAVAAVGSVIGNLCVYYPARKAGQAYYHATHTHPPGKIQQLVQKYPIACVFLPALAPFPVPIKPFTVAQGVFQVPLLTFLVGTVAGRACRFSAEAFLGVRYGPAAQRLLFTQKWLALAILAVLVLLVFLIRRLPIFHHGEGARADARRQSPQPD
jgi:membrane protein YqaA with SNARE-associated domain